MTWPCCGTAEWARASPAPTPLRRWDRFCARSPSGTSARPTRSPRDSCSTSRSTPNYSAACGSPEIVEGSLCRFSVESGGLVVDRRQAGGGTVPALVVVEAVAPVDHHRAGLRGAVELVPGEHLPLQAGEERLRGCVVKARADPAHRLADPQPSAQTAELVGLFAVPGE